MVDIFPWVLSATSIWCTFEQGNKGKLGWAMGFVNTMLWIVYTLVTHQWGLIPLNIVLAVIHVRNYRKQDTFTENAFIAKLSRSRRRR
jgi:hypothetical protein